MGKEREMMRAEIRARARELADQMTLEEKVSQMLFNAPAIPRLGIPEYNWWGEALHGVARAGTATVIPQAIGMAAMFDADLLQEIGDAVATEGRAKFHESIRQNDRDIYKGLTFWSPNINIFRDPRWGRGHETYGEDPYLTSRLGVAYIRGLQGDGKYLKTAACAKHYAVHSGPERRRHSFDAKVSPKDLEETYLPAFEAAVREAKVESVMGAYNRTNGEPCCGSKTLIQDILREKWEFDGHFVSDCGAIADFHLNHHVTHTAPESAAMAVNNGCDLNCGRMYGYLLAAHAEGLISEETITESVIRLMETRIRLGLFDDDCEYADIPFEKNDCAEHHDLALKAARRSMVLLRNNGILPLNRDKLKTVAVIGPNADSRAMLLGNYNGTPSQYITILDGIREAILPQTRLYYAQGCHLVQDMEGLNYSYDSSLRMDNREAEAVSTAERADVVVLCLGLDASIEGEEGDENNPYAGDDKKGVELPGRQQHLLERLLETGKPVVVVLGAGSAISLQGREDDCAAILHAWYPGALGGRAVADILFGKCSPSGKLPVTFYRSTEELPAFEDYSMRGRTYRYMHGDALYPFGYGLTYSKLALSDASCAYDKNAFDGARLSVTAANIGACATHEVLQCYIKDLESPDAVPNHSLCAFQPIFLEKDASGRFTLDIPAQAFEVVHQDGSRAIDSKRFALFVGFSQPDARSVSLMGSAPVQLEMTL